MGEKNKKIKYISLAEATKYCDYSQEYLSLLARRGLIKAVKIGRNWFTTRDDLVHYIQKTAIKNGEIDSQNIALIDVAKEFGLSVDHLRGLASQGNFPAEQIGQAWFTTRKDIENYFQDFPRPGKKTTRIKKEYREDLAPNVQFRNAGIFASRPALRSVLVVVLAIFFVFLNIFMITDGAMARKGGNFKKVAMKMSGVFAAGARSAEKNSQAINNVGVEKIAAFGQSLQKANQKISNGARKQITQSGQEKVLATIETVKNIPGSMAQFAQRSEKGTVQLIADARQAVSDQKEKIEQAAIDFPQGSKQAGGNFKSWFGQAQEGMIAYAEEQGQKIKDLPQNLNAIWKARRSLVQIRDSKQKFKPKIWDDEFLEEAAVAKDNFSEQSVLLFNKINKIPQGLKNWGTVLVDNTPFAIEGAVDFAEKGKEEAFSWPADFANAGKKTWQNLIAAGEEITRLPSILREKREDFYQAADEKTKTMILGAATDIEQTKTKGNDLYNKTKVSAQDTWQNKKEATGKNLGLAWSRSALKFNRGLEASLDLAGEAANQALSLLASSGENVFDLSRGMSQDYQHIIQGLSNLYLVYDYGAAPNGYSVLGRVPGESAGNLKLITKDETETGNQVQVGRPEPTAEGNQSSSLDGDAAPKESDSNITLQYVTTNGASTDQILSLRGSFFSSGVQVGELAQFSRSIDIKERLTVGTLAVFSGDIIAHKSLIVDKNLIVGDNNFYVDTENEKVGIGTAFPSEKLDVAGNLKVEKALLVVEEAHLFDNLMVDGWSRLTGILEANGGIVVRGNKFIVDGETGDIETAGTLRVHNDGWFNRNLYIGNGTDDLLEVRSRIGSDLIPSANETYNLGSSALYWNKLYVKNIYTSGNVGINLDNPQGGMQITGDEVRIGDAGTLNYASGDGDLYVEDVLEVDGTIYAGSIAPAGMTPGSVVFIDGSGNLAQDNSNFFWDDTNNRLGIGTASPGVSLDVNNGWIQASNQYGLAIKDTTGTGRISVKVDSSNNLQIGDNNTFANILFLPGATEKMRLTSAGNLGIGYTDPAGKLAVNGNVGIGTTGPGAKLDILASSTATSGSATGSNLLLNINPADTASASYYGTMSIADYQASLGTNSGYFVIGDWGEGRNSGTAVLENTVGGWFRAANTSSGTINDAYGAVGQARNSGAGTMVRGYGLVGAARNNAAGTITNAVGVYGDIINANASGTITNAYNIRATVPYSNAGTIQNLYGVYIDPQSPTGGGTINNKWAFYQAGTSDKSYFAGNVGIGTTSPDKQLEVYGSSNALRLSYNDTYYTDLSTGSSGDLTLNPTGGNVLFADTRTLAIGGATGQAYNVIGDTTTGMSHSLASDDDLYLEGDLEVEGNVWFDSNVTLGSTTANNLTINAYVYSDIIPYTGSQYDLGSNTRHWQDVYADNIYATNVVGVIVTGSTISNDWLINSDNTSPDTEDATLTFERGSPAVNAEIRWDASASYISTNAGAFVINPDVGVTAPATAAILINQIHNNPLISANYSSTNRFIVTNTGEVQTGDLNLGLNDTSATITTYDTNENLTIDPSGTGDLYFHGSTYELSDSGDLTIGGRITFENGEYMSNETDDLIILAGASGSDNTDLYFNLDSTYPVIYSNTDTKIGVDDDLEFVGAQTIYTSTGDLTFAPVGNLVINTTSGTIDIDDITLDLSTQTMDVTLNNAVDALNFDANTLSIDAANNRVGIGTTTPDKQLEVYGSSNALRLSYNDTYYTDLSTGSLGDLTLNPTGGNVVLADTRTIAIGGATGQAYNVIGDTTTGMSHSLASDDDLYLEGDLEVEGSAWFDSSVTVASTITVASSKFIVDANGDIVKLKNLTYSFPSSHTANGVLTNNGSGTLTWATVGASNITPDSLDFTEFQDTLDLDANLTLNQTTYTWSQTYTGTTAPGFTYTASGALTSGNSAFDLNVSNASTTIPALMITNAGSSYSLRINDDGTTTDTTPFVVDADGNVGIGVTNPAVYKLDVAGTGRFTGIVTADSLKIQDTNDSNTLNLVWNEDDTSDRALNFLVVGGSRNLTLNENFTISDGYNVSMTALGQDNAITLNEGLTIGDGSSGTLTFSGASKVLTVEDNSTINQDLTTDANPTFAGVNAGNINVGITGDNEIDTDSGNLTLDSVSGTVLVDDELRLALSLYAPTGTMAFGGADTQSYNVIGDTTTNMSHSLASDDDLYIEGDLEVDGSAWFDASVTVAGTFTSASSKFIVDTNGDIVKLKNLTYSFPSSHTTNGVLTNNGSGTLTWATVGASSITDDSLDFAQFEDTLDLDANLTLNQTAYTWAQTYTGTAGAGFTYTASGALTSGNSAFDLNISNASATIPAMMITNAGSSYALRINDDGTTTDTTPFVVDASGNVGIGDTNADAKLDIMASQTSGILQQISYESAATLAGNLIGLDLDLYTNVTPSTYNVTGINLELPTGASGDMTFLKFLEGSSTLYDFDVTSAQFNVPASFNNAGDVSLAYDLIFTNNSAAYLTFNGPGYVRTDDPAGNYDLTLLAANSGAIVVNDFLEVSDSTASTALAIINQTGGGPILDIEQNGTSKLYITNGGNVGIGVTAAGSLLHIATDTTALGQTVFEQASADSDAWDLNFRKARGTVASPTVITTGDELGAINFRGYSGAGGYVTGAAIKAISEGTVATTRVPANLSFWTGTDAVPSVLTERMRIDKAGNIGIGTTSPDAQLEVYGSSNKLRLSYNDTYYTDLSTTSAGNLAINTVGGTIDIDDGVLDFATQTVDITLNNAVDALNFDSNTLSIDASNNYVGIGTAAPVSLLSLSSSTASPILTLTNASDTTTYDPTINFRTGATPAVRQSIWLDDSDSDKLKFGLTGATYPALTIGTDGYFLSQIPDNSTTAFEIKEATNSYLTFDTTNDAEKIVVGKNLEVGTLKVDANSGAVNFIDMDITGTDPAGTTQSLSVALDGNVVATFYGEANGAGVLQNPRFGVGVTEPNYKLDVLQVSTTGPSYAANFFNDGDTSPYHGLRVQAGADDASGTTYYLDAYDGNGGSVGYLANVAGTFDVTDVSDVSTKTNIENTSLSGLNIINGLRVVDFNRSQNPDGPVIHGFVAQEVQAVFPEMVSEGLDGLLGLQKSLLIPVLVKAVQEQQTGFDLKIEGLESGLGNQELGIAELESRIGDLESGIGNQESRIGNLENKTTVADGSGEQADLESLQGALQTLVNSLSNLENVSSELDNLGASILTVMENSEVNAARIDELEQETKNLNQIVKVVEDAVVIGDLNKFIVLDSATGLEIKSANFSLDRDGNVIASGEIKTKIGRISSETGILELNPGEANDTVPNPKVVIAGDLEIQGKIILGAASQKDGEEETQDQPEADATTGKAKILAGETAIVIANNNVTENSLIYITPTSKTGGQVLYLDGQRAEDETNPDDPEETLPRGFTVAIEKAVEEELEFNWFVVDSH